MSANSENGLQMVEPLIDPAMGMKSPAFAGAQVRTSDDFAGRPLQTRRC